jgi:hypothetical protein
LRLSQAHASDARMQSVDAIFVSLPAALAELFLPFNK